MKFQELFCFSWKALELLFQGSLLSEEMTHIQVRIRLDLKIIIIIIIIIIIKRLTATSNSLK